jgi:hypothetical protein
MRQIVETDLQSSIRCPMLPEEAIQNPGWRAGAMLNQEMNHSVMASWSLYPLEDVKGFVAKRKTGRDMIYGDNDSIQ